MVESPKLLKVKEWERGTVLHVCTIRENINWIMFFSLPFFLFLIQLAAYQIQVHFGDFHDSKYTFIK